MSELIPLIPNMTDYNKPSGLVTESGHNASDYGWRAFTDDSGSSRDFWYIISNGEKWIQYDFENEVELSAVELNASSVAVSGSNYGIKNFTIKDMSNNKVLFQGVHPNNSSTIRYEFNHTISKSVRIDITDSYYDTNHALIGRVQCFGRENIERKFITVDNGGTILSYEDGKVKKSNEVTPSEEIITPFSLENTVDYIEDVNGNITQFNGSFLDFIKAEYNGEFSFLTCTNKLTASNCRIQTTHELNLLQDDLLQADKIQLLNWFADEENVNLKVYGELNNKFTSINKVINHEQVLKIVADSLGNAKFLVSEDKITWKRWNTTEWETVTFSHKDEIATLGMSKNALKDITKAQWEQLGHEFYLGVYLDKQTEIKNINYQSGIPNLTPEISNASLYILNTTATLDITLQGNKLYGAVTDDDKGKVQYRIILNGDPYLPDDGTFSPLEPEPQNINLRIPSDKLNIGGNNTIRIEFQDAWGSLDYWQTSFIGELNGLLFFDEQGELYSDELGEVIKPLDFGTIITGQMSLEHKIIFKNTLGQPVKDVKFFSDWGEYNPIAGVGYRFSLSDSPFAGYEVLELERPVDHEEEVEIFVKMSTILGTTPETLGKVKFCVKATEIDDDEYQEILNNLS